MNHLECNGYYLDIPLNLGPHLISFIGRRRVSPSLGETFQRTTYFLLEELIGMAAATVFGNRYITANERLRSDNLTILARDWKKTYPKEWNDLCDVVQANGTSLWQKTITVHMVSGLRAVVV